MTKSEPTNLAYEAFRELLVLNRQPTKRVLVEFYEGDWERIAKVKEDLDLSWKDLFHAIRLWLNVFESDSEAHQLLANLVNRKEGGR
jgi:hypothetical protein